MARPDQRIEQTGASPVGPSPVGPSPVGPAFRPGNSESTQAGIPGLEYERFFTKEGVDPFDEMEWDLRSAVIGSEKGEVVFEQRDVEIPRSWSQQATNIVVSKYFRGQMG